MNVIRSSIRQPVTVTVGILLILLAGMIASTRLPIALTPTVDKTVVTVTTFWEGASPEEVELNIIDKQEERLLGLSDLRHISSSSGQSSGTIRLEFNNGADKDAVLREVSDKLREVPEYPENVDEPVVDATDSQNRDYIAWVVFGTDDPDFDIRTLRDFAIDRIEPVLENVKGISEVNVLGGRERELQVRIDPVRLAQFGVTPAELVRVIRDVNRNVSAGRVSSGKRDIGVRTIGQYESVEQVEATVIRRDENGVIRVSDVATVVDTFKEPSGFVRSKGVPVIAINADREIGSNVMEVMERYRAAIDELNEPGGVLDMEAKRLGLDGGLWLRQVYDQTVYIDDAVALVRNNIWIGGALAIMVLIIFLRSLRSVAIITLAIPISVVGAIVAMVAMGRSINVISLAGMAFAVGMVVDNAIVVLENIFRHIEMGKSPKKAAFAGTKEVWGAVLASTLTTVAVFIPILLVQEEAGQLFRDIALAICAAVALSLIVSITVIPTMAARLFRGMKSREERKPHWWDRLNIFALIPRGFSRLIYMACGSVIVRVLLIVVLSAASVWGSLKLMPPADYLPSGNRNLIFGMLIPPPGYNIEQYESMADRIEERVEPFWEAGYLIDDSEAYEKAVAELPEVPSFSWTGPGPPVRPPSIENYFLVQFGNILFHGGVSDDPTRVSDLIHLFNHATASENVPGVFAFPFQVPLFQLGGSTGSAIKLELTGQDLDAVKNAALVVLGGLSSNDSFQSVVPSPSNFNIESPEVQVFPDHIRLGELGLTTADVGMAVRAAGDGAIIDEFKVGGESIDLKVVVEQAVTDPASALAAMRDLPIAAPDGTIVPLGSIAEIVRTGRDEEIARVSRQRAITFEVTPAQGVPLEAAITELEDFIDGARASGAIPPIVNSDFSGSAGKLADVRAALLGDGTVVGTLSSSLVLALIVVYLLMCVLFQSFVRPLVILFSVPLATLGGFAALFGVFIWSATDPYMPMQQLDVLTMLGFVILIGVVVNNAILIVHQTLNFMRGEGDSIEGEGLRMEPREAIAEAVRTRIRPIFMGTMTSVGGMAPLVLMPGAGSELYRGLGSVVVGGLLVSTIFTLVLVPLLLSLVFDMQALIFGHVPEHAPETDDELAPGSAVPAFASPSPPPAPTNRNS